MSLKNSGLKVFNSCLIVLGCARYTSPLFSFVSSSGCSSLSRFSFGSYGPRTLSRAERNESSDYDPLEAESLLSSSLWGLPSSSDESTMLRAA